MLAKLRSRLTFANVVSVIALFVALGGSGYAATKINGKNIKNNSISGRKLKARSITRDKIAKHTLTGTEINLSRLGTVPKADQAGTAGLAANATNAAHAGSADTAATAGNGARRVDFSGTRSDPAPADLPPSPAVHQVLTLDELTVRASCIDAGSGQGRLYVTFSASADGDLTWEDIRFSNPGITPESDGAALGPMSNANFAVIDITGGNRSVDGQFIYRNPAHTITLALHGGAGDFNPLGDGSCELEGTAVAAPG